MGYLSTTLKCTVHTFTNDEKIMMMMVCGEREGGTSLSHGQYSSMSSLYRVAGTGQERAPLPLITQ